MVFSSCENDSNSSSTGNQFTLLSPSQTGIDFSNDLPVKLDLNILNYMYYYNGGGLGVADLNNDGLQDLVMSSNLDQEKVYLNQGGLKFNDVSKETGVDGGPNSWTNGVAIADVNADGLNDIYLSQVGAYRHLDCKNKLFICTGIDENNIPSYTEQAAEWGLDFQGFSTQAGFLDYDLDGDLDMFLMNHSLHHNGTFGQREEFLNTYDEKSGDRFFRNDGNTYTEVTKESGIHSSVIGYGLGMAFGDVNLDGYPDIYVGNDFHENDYLYINQGDGTFKDLLVDQMKHTSRFSMGVDMADIDADLDLDIVSLDMLPEDPKILKMSEGEDALDIFNFKLGYGYNHQYARNNLQLNNGNDRFSEIGAYANIHATDWSWTPLFFDMNLDGHQDLFISNGIPKRMNDIDYINFISGNEIQAKIQFDKLKEEDMSVLDKIPEIKLKNKFYLGSTNLQFADIEGEIGKHKMSYSNSSAYADLDNDGDYDLVCNNINDQLFIYRNNENPENFVKLKLDGPKGNTNALGTYVVAEYTNRKQLYHHFSSRGFQSSMLNNLILPSDSLMTITIIWPDKTYKTLQSWENGENEVAYTEGMATFNFNELRKPCKYYASDVTDEKGVNFVHDENPFVEFNREPLIPFATSSDGPAMALGDINNDGLTDVYVGAAKRRNSAMYIQKRNGDFSKVQLVGTSKDSIFEEVDALMVDIDNDDDTDLVVATGGNEYRLNSEYTRPLLYLNEGGVLTRSESAFQGVHLTGSTVSVCDIDQDGTKELFFGARAFPREYGTPTRSYIVSLNPDGMFEDQSEKFLNGDPNIGFIKDSETGDFDGDGDDDILIAKEWGGISLLENVNGQLNEKTIFSSSGWWNGVISFDFDNDGDLDIFCGNLGLNARIKASKDQRIKMYHGDFDENGTKEQILTYFVGDREIIFSNLKELQKQMPYLKKKYLYAKDFAEATVSEIVGSEALSKATVFEADFFESMVLINEGNMNFKPLELPKEMQYTSYKTAVAVDVNEDGFVDLIPGGNFYYCNVQMGRYDADWGIVLINNEGKEFSVENLEAYPAHAEVRQLNKISVNDKMYILAAQNEAGLKMFSIEKR